MKKFIEVKFLIIAEPEQLNEAELKQKLSSVDGFDPDLLIISEYDIETLEEYCVLHPEKMASLHLDMYSEEWNEAFKKRMSEVVFDDFKTGYNKGHFVKFYPDTMQRIASFAYCTHETLSFTYEIVKQLYERKVPGMLVECGVGAGANLAAMRFAMANIPYPYSCLHRRIIGFDSFEGIPLAGPNDADQPGIGAITHDVNLPERERLVSSGITVHSLDNVTKNIEHALKMITGAMLPIQLVKGWFQNTMYGEEAERIEQIALLRLDGDLYESTIVCLRSLYEKVHTEGIVIIDDYALPGCKKAVLNFLSEYYSVPELDIEKQIQTIPGGGGPAYFLKSWFSF